MFSAATNCAICKALSSQVFFNVKKKRICCDCIQKEYDLSCSNLQAAVEQSVEAANKNKLLEQKVALYDAILDQIKNFTNLRKE